MREKERMRKKDEEENEKEEEREKEETKTLRRRKCNRIKWPIVTNCIKHYFSSGVCFRFSPSPSPSLPPIFSLFISAPSNLDEKETVRKRERESHPVNDDEV